MVKTKNERDGGNIILKVKNKEKEGNIMVKLEKQSEVKVENIVNDGNIVKKK